MYVLKAVPEDFVVKELYSYEVKERGRHQMVWLCKRNYTTMRAVEHIAKALRIPAKSIRFAGIKDKNAVTEQMLSLKPCRLQASLKDIALTHVGYRDEPLHVGELDGNAFWIVIRNLKEGPGELSRVVNYFGEQRFSQVNAQVGKKIVKKEFLKACDMIRTNDADTRDILDEVLASRPNDPVGALSKLPPRVVRLYVNAYQSLLWNRMAERIVRDYPDIAECELPLIGFGTEVADSRIRPYVEEVMREEAITYRDFIIRQFPKLSSEGDSRALFVPLTDLSVGSLQDDELYPGMKKCRVTFSLPPGSYATVVVDALLEPQ